MRAAVVSPPSSVRALALGLGVAIALLGTSLAHGQTLPSPAPQQIAQGLLPPLPNESFICWTRMGDGCGLRDGQGFAARPLTARPAIGR